MQEIEHCNVLPRSVDDMLFNGLKLLMMQFFGLFRRRETLCALTIKKRTLEEIESFYCTHPFAPQRGLQVDDTTWNDLNMTDLFKKLGTCYTTAGLHWLYAAMHHSLFQKADLDQRQSTLKALTDYQIKEPRCYRKIEALLYRIGGTKTNVLEQIDQHMKGNMILLACLFFLRYALIGIVLYTVIGYTAMTLPFHQLALSLVLLFACFNILIHFTIEGRIGEQVGALAYIGNVLGSASRLEQLIKPVLPEHAKQLAGIRKNLKTLHKQCRGVLGLEVAMNEAGYINILIFKKTIAYLKSAGTIENCRSDVHELYQLIGEIDGLMAIAKHHYLSQSNASSQRDDASDNTDSSNRLGPLCYPSFIFETGASGMDLLKKVGENSGLRVEEIYHPLLLDPVSNDIQFNRSIAITGSNMSGKSTFLRALAMSALCAQTICTAFSKSYMGEPVRVISSISLNDHVGQGKSYYLAEAEAILRMIKSNQLPGVRNLFFIDEIFKGTNANERVIAASEILNHLEIQGALVCVTTHDLQILEKLAGYVLYHFTENVTDASMTFSYKIHSGRSSTQNAIKILAHLKYPKELIARMMVGG